ncbi:SDR family oxidoreductase [Terricaulis sp.]|uniref:SDR family oxidoreductase n=1 Tax=Terricaulis sp. TaxID=2768686 RepID=UPI0037842347
MAQPKTAIVLGASELGGTGWVTAEALAARGVRVAVAARRVDKAAELARSIGGEAFQCDATREPDVEAFVRAATAAFGAPIDYAVMAAGAGVSGMIDDISDAELRRSFDLNYFASVYFVRHAARVVRDGGAIVLMSSIAGTNAWPGYFSYGGAKAALQMLVKYAALEYAPRRIRVNAVCPGPIQTPAAMSLLAHPEAGAIAAAEMPLGRASTPAEVAEAVVWLAMAPSWVTGETVHVDGGLHLRRPPDVDAIRAALKARPRAEKY